MNVTLTTDDPLQFHLTQSPLLEEYSIASQRWGLSQVDLSEIARNSVLQSGFDHSIKEKVLGKHYYLPGIDGNDISFSNIADIRINFRWETLEKEKRYLYDSSTSTNLFDSKAEITFDPVYTKIKLAVPKNTSYTPKDANLYCAMLEKALDLRQYYRNSFHHHPYAQNSGKSLPKESIDTSQYHFQLRDGVMLVFPKSGAEKPLFEVPSVEVFTNDLKVLSEIASSGPENTFCTRRLKLISCFFHTHILLNEKLEKSSVKLSKRSGYQLYRVDTHCHASSSMPAQQLLQFAKFKMQKEPDTVVNKNGDTVTGMFTKLGLNKDNITLDSLAVRAENTYKRLDKYLTKYNPFGSEDLRCIFLKSDNFIQGRFFAELLKDTWSHTPENRHYEMRISIYGKSKDEWTKLAKWAHTNDLIQPEKNTWVVQVPRNYYILKSRKVVNSFAEFLSNIFGPLFQVSLDPSSDPSLHLFLSNVGSFDSVDDESGFNSKNLLQDHMFPQDWTTEENPSFAYYQYYMYANLVSLNQLRARKGLPTFDYRPHCGSSGLSEHLAVGFLLAGNITHGITLQHNSTLQYLFYLAQIGISLSPLSENAVHTRYEKLFSKFSPPSFLTL